jgi:hypothetical protein
MVAYIGHLQAPELFSDIKQKDADFAILGTPTPAPLDVGLNPDN